MVPTTIRQKHHGNRTNLVFILFLKSGRGVASSRLPNCQATHTPPTEYDYPPGFDPTNNGHHRNGLCSAGREGSFFVYVGPTLQSTWASPTEPSWSSEPSWMACPTVPSRWGRASWVRPWVPSSASRWVWSSRASPLALRWVWTSWGRPSASRWD